jgi:hypothetical protein
LANLVQHVRNSDVLAIIQSAEVLQRPWCLLEMYAAIEAGIPIIAIAVSGKGYDFATATDLLLHLDTALDIVNPGATDLLRSEGVEPIDIAFRLSNILPKIISLPFNGSESANRIKASLSDIVDAMQTALPLPLEQDQARWLKNRPAASIEARRHGDASPAVVTPTAAVKAVVTTTLDVLAPVPSAVPGTTASVYSCHPAYMYVLCAVL